jgi:peptidyl-prolyl cis-trans isomerase D
MVRAFPGPDTKMLASFRKFAGTWPARIFFLVLVASFASWGIADVVRKIGGGSDAVATVQGQDITPNQFMQEYMAGLRRYAEQLPDPTQIPQALRQRVAMQTLEKLVTQQALADQVARLGVVVPDSQLRDAVFAMPDFQGPDGKFSRPTLLQVLSSNHLSEAQFLDLVRKDIAQNELLQSVGAASTPSKMLTGLVYRYLNEKRTADIALLNFDGSPLPAPPSDSVLRRFYANNPSRYTAPEYRHIKAVILSPDSIGRSLTVSDAELKAWFDQHKHDYVSPEKRSLQVITTGSAATASLLAAKWRGGASWESMEAAAKAAGASSVELKDATPAEVPSPELEKAAFAATGGAVVGPINEPLGVQLVRVTAITEAKNPSFDSLRATIRDKVAAEKALDLIDARAQKLQDLFAGGAKIDEVPADLGATGAAGTLDAQGNTQEGTPAPIPVPADVRQAVIDAAFKTNPGDAIQPVEGANHVWYAIAVDNVTKPAKRPFEQVAAKVLADWQSEQVRHTQETEAAHLLSLVKSGQTLANAAWGSGVRVTRTPKLARNKPQDGLSAELIHTLFSLKPGEATMAEAPTGFVVAQLADIVTADPSADPAGMTQAQDGLAHALHDDYLTIYAMALREQAKPTLRPNVMNALIRQQGE